ncbi:MAG: ABC transporter substrate binding protein [Syntrophobacteraceae bacterium]
MELWVGAIILGFMYAFMTMGSFITFRVHHFPDITVDGSLTAGAAISAVLIAAGWDPFLSLGMAFLAGAAAGSVTAVINTRLNINGLLAGILVMTGLYSINLHVMGRSNIPLINNTTVITYLEKINPGLPLDVWILVSLIPVMLLFWLCVSLFFRTDFGISMLATGNNPTMAAAAGVNVEKMKILGVAVANGLTGLSGGIVAQYQAFADLGMGIGTVVTGLASVIIGESVLPFRSIYAKILGAIVGSVIFRLMIALALSAGVNPTDLKLLTALFVLGALVLPKVFSGWGSVKKAFSNNLLRASPNARLFKILGLGLAAVVIFILGFQLISPPSMNSGKVRRIGIVQVLDHSMLNLTREGFLKELETLGYRDGENCSILYRNAHGDLATVNTILDDFLRAKVDLVVAISTACTQAAINKIKDRPVVFATVADPFVIGAGKSDTEHLPNVTGVYGIAPMDKLLEIVRATMPHAVEIGCMWDPSQTNAVLNVERLQEAVAANADLTFVGTTVSGTSEVYQGALSLVQRGIDAFVLPPDNVVYSAFESVVKAAKARKIPIYIADVERIQDGALAALGYDYTSSGEMAARLADRIFKGENPEKMPFQRYTKLTFALNADAARELGVKIPPEIVSRATHIHGDRSFLAATPGPAPPESAPSVKRAKRLVLYHFTDGATIMEGVKGVTEELERDGFLDRHGIKMDRISAQSDWNLAQAIAQDIIRQKYDLIITLSTPTLQMMARVNREIPLVFGMVTDPFRLGVATDEREHLPNVTGVATRPPVEATVRTMRELFPQARKIGIVWNPSDASSEACTNEARKAAAAHGFELLEATVSSTGDVMDAVKSLVARGIDLFFTSNDNTVALAVVTSANILRQRKIPYFSNSPVHVEKGAFLAMGADYEEVGKETAKVAKRIIAGENPKTIPISNFTLEKIFINLELAKEYGIELPEALVSRAANIKR